MKKLQVIFLACIISVFTCLSVSAETNAKYREVTALSFSGSEKIRSDETEALLKSALELYKQKKYAEALANCIKATQLSPNDFRPHSISGIIYMAQ